MTRAPAFLGLMLLAAGMLSLSGCPPPKPPHTEATPAVLDMEQYALLLVNNERAAAGVGTLAMDERVRAVARAHSEDMLARGFFSHTNPDGESPFQRLANADITYSYAGENLAWNNYPTPAEFAVQGWMDSAGHHANLLRPQFNRAGLGVATDGAGTWYFTLDFIGTTAKNTGEAVFYYEEAPQTPAE